MLRATAAQIDNCLRSQSVLLFKKNSWQTLTMKIRIMKIPESKTTYCVNLQQALYAYTLKG